jgi:acyl-coenzyme A synthetase/AMP-(fatty) acid ligase
VPTLPLILRRSCGRPIAYRDGQGIPEAVFLRDAAALAARLPADRQLLNLCEDRYHFAVAMGAGLISARATLLPPSQAPEALRRVRDLAAPLVCITDEGAATAALLELRCPILTVDCGGDLTAAPVSVPQIDAAQTAVIIFTSGSTGMPVPHAKSFGQMAEGARVQLTQLPGAAAEPGYALLATVPAQHMFGLEATVLLPMQGPHALCAERPFYPADIGAALARLPRPRALISTPVHLGALLDAGIDVPALDLVLCATAPLAQPLAQEVEARCKAPLIEIYGSTETGMIARRRTALEHRWQLFPRMRLRRAEAGWCAQGGHLPVAMPLADELELLDAEHFLLHGRTADLVNVAGKRSSLAYLSQQLLSIPGVQDGAFFLQETARSSMTGVTRLAALVVAPGLTCEGILTILRERVDAVFLPRPLWLVDQLPRNATGKLAQEALQMLATQLSSQRAHERS